MVDGGTITIRALRPEDREELRSRYEELSDESRRLRFVSAPAHLSPGALDRLLDVDFRDRYAIVAALGTEPDAPGVGIARFVRSARDPQVAEAAVTVVDAHQGRGIGTALLSELVIGARARGITEFVGDVMWDNREFLKALREHGAEVMPGEPGLASVRIQLPDQVDDLRRSELYRVMRTIGVP